MARSRCSAAAADSPAWIKTWPRFACAWANSGSSATAFSNAARAGFRSPAELRASPNALWAIGDLRQQPHCFLQSGGSPPRAFLLRQDAAQ